MVAEPVTVPSEAAVHWARMASALRTDAADVELHATVGRFVAVQTPVVPIG